MTLPSRRSPQEMTASIKLVGEGCQLYVTDLVFIASRRSLTRRSYSSMGICGSHWNAVCGFGTNHEVDTVMRTPRVLLSALSRQACMTWAAMSAMPSTSSSVSVGRPSIK